ncbi:acyl-CoA dehydrogenase family protein [Flavobacteriaceae bacterium]|nr:acyl-CoA dehydrogenase family protein [Flavobacteriaceae bacterium]
METKSQNNINGGSFLISKIDPDQVFTPEDFSEEQRMMKEAVIEFIDREVWPHKERFEKKDYAFTESLMKKAGELGFLSIPVPENYGGMGMGFVSTMLVCDFISGASGSLSTAFGAHTGIGILPILLYGTEDQKQEYLPKLASGEWFGSYCLTEPGAGSDANSGKTKAVLSEDGSYYEITGQKMWISNAGFASLFIVFARIEDDKNITGFIVPLEENNGIELGEEENKLGIHASSTRQVFFNKTKIPVENVLGERNGGFKIAMNALNVGRIKLGVACLDAQRRVTSKSIEYANERIQFNRPIASFGAIKEKIAQMASSCYAGESTCYRAANDVEQRIQNNLDKGLSHQEAELKGVENFAIECSLIKVGASEDVQNCADQGIQILGGMGFSADTPMESAWRDARIGRIYEGTNEINRMLSVGLLLKKGMKGELELMPAVMQAAMRLGSEKANEIADGPLAQEHQLIENFKQLFLMIAGNATQKYGTKLEEEQQVLQALADVLIEIYFSESAVLRTLKNCNRSGVNSQEIQIAMTQNYVFEAQSLIAKRIKEVILHLTADNKDERNQLLYALKKHGEYIDHPDSFELRTKIADHLIKENKYCF